MGCFLKHKWGMWGKIVNTGNHIYKAQFRSCKSCGKIDVRFISLWTSSSCEVDEKIINSTCWGDVVKENIKTLMPTKKDK